MDHRRSWRVLMWILTTKAKMGGVHSSPLSSRWLEHPSRKSVSVDAIAMMVFGEDDLGLHQLLNPQYLQYPTIYVAWRSQIML